MSCRMCVTALLCSDVTQFASRYFLFKISYREASWRSCRKILISVVDFIFCELSGTKMAEGKFICCDCRCLSVVQDRPGSASSDLPTVGRAAHFLSSVCTSWRSTPPAPRDVFACVLGPARISVFGEKPARPAGTASSTRSGWRLPTEGSTPSAPRQDQCLKVPTFEATLSGCSGPLEPEMGGYWYHRIGVLLSQDQCPCSALAIVSAWRRIPACPATARFSSALPCRGLGEFLWRHSWCYSNSGCWTSVGSNVMHRWMASCWLWCVPCWCHLLCSLYFSLYFLCNPSLRVVLQTVERKKLDNSISIF